VTSPVSDAPPVDFAEVARVPPTVAAGRVVRTVVGMMTAEFHRVRHQPWAVATRTAQPLLWILVFGAALSGVRGLHGTDLDYQTFVVPGVLGQSVLTVALFSGLAIIWERDLGLTQRYLVAPGPRAAVIVGKALGASVRVMFHLALVLVIVRLVGVPISVSPARVLGVFGVAIPGAMLFACLSMVIASMVRSREQFMGLGQLIILPLFFASNALYAIELMPGWLQAVATVNPLTYLVSSLRYLLLGVGDGAVVRDVAVLLAGSLVFAAIAARTYPKRAL
jgi:ABC-2 type transport system permease protein